MGFLLRRAVEEDWEQIKLIYVEESIEWVLIKKIPASVPERVQGILA
ncbi:hypothetical protein [Paenibacillus sp. GSMTC-2017]|nr:hypothetical protein [Paenibacillus sp. GSMTC-2017]